MNVRKFLFATLLLVFSFCKECIAQVDLQNNLIAYFPFDMDVLDYSGNEHHGQLFGASQVEGIFGNAYKFDGLDDYIFVNYDQELHFEQGANFAISFWYKRDKTNEFNVAGDLISIWDSEHLDNPYSYAVRLFTKHSDRKGQLAVGRYDGNDFDCYHVPYTYSHPVRDEEWHHALYQLDENDYLQLYIDGEFSSEILDETTCALTSESDLYIGIRSIYFDSSGNRPFSGSIDEVRIYGRTLTNDEIAALSSTTVTSVEVLMDEKVKVYPTPSSGQISIESANSPVSQIKTFNSLGQVQVFGKVNSIQLDEPGIHLLEIVLANGVKLHEKVLIVK